MEDTPTEVYVVIDSRFGPIATGSKSQCLSYISGQLDTQSEDTALQNPASFRLVKVTQLS